MDSQFVLASFCNNPESTTSPVLCAKVSLSHLNTLEYAPVSLGFPGLINSVTGLAKGHKKIFVFFVSQAKSYVSVLRESDLIPLFYQGLPEIKDGHSLTVFGQQLYIVSTGTDEVLRYDISENALENPRIAWRASEAGRDTHHINSIVEKDDDLLISAFGPKTGQLWATASNGYIHNITRNIRVKEGVHHPHSLSVRGGKLYYADSQRNTFCSIDDEVLFTLNGYTRGIVWLSDDVICAATSIGRKISKSTGLINNPSDPGEPAGECGLLLGSISKKKIFRKKDLSWFGPEVYDVLLLEKSQIDLLMLANVSQVKERQAIQTLISEKEQSVQALTVQAQSLNKQIQSLNKQVQSLNNQLAEKESSLNQILGSKSWRLVQNLRQQRLRIAPIGSHRERLLQVVWRDLLLLRSQGVVVSLRHSFARLLGKTVQYTGLQKTQRATLKNSNRSYKPVAGLPDFLRKKARQIKESGFFDYEWYLNDNPGVYETGVDPVEHYLLHGIRDERNPNPLFNTSIYSKELGVAKEDALLHFAESGRLFAPGAYRSAEILMTAQKRYYENLNMKCIKDNHTGNNKYAVYFQCGTGSVHEKWLKASGENWDLFVNHYDQTYINKIPCNVEFVQIGNQPGTKFTSFNLLLTNWPNLINSYRYILLLDDDILIDEKDINLLFSIADDKGLDLAQASLSSESYSAHPVLKNSGSGGMRYLNSVEIMMPVISQSTLKLGGHLFNQTISGWGLDIALSKFIGPRSKIAVIDDIVATHVKPINVEEGAFYKMLHRAYIYPEIELTHLQRIYGLGRSLYETALHRI
jgi:hypothetical protein